MADNAIGGTPAPASTYVLAERNMARIAKARDAATHHKVLGLFTKSNEGDPIVMNRLAMQEQNITKLLELYGKRFDRG